MFSKIFSIIILLFFSIFINSSLFSFLLFKSNQKVIIKDSCEKIVENCEGKCYLNKSIEKNEKSTNGESEVQRINISPVLFFETKKIDLIITSKSEFISQYCLLNISNGYTFIEDKPPKI